MRASVSFAFRHVDAQDVVATGGDADLESEKGKPIRTSTTYTWVVFSEVRCSLPTRG